MRNWSKWSVAVSLGLAGIVGTVGTSGAAGGGYGPGAAVPGGVPGGFTIVVTARTLGPGGGTVHAKIDGFSVTANVPGGALPNGGQVAFTRAKDGAVKHGLIGPLRGDSVVFAMGIVLDHNGRGLTSTKPISVTITNPKLKVGDVIVAYRGGKFVKIGVVTVAGQATVDVRGVTELAVLSP